MSEWLYSIEPDEIPLFQADIEEHLLNIEQVLLALEQGEQSDELLRTFFRAAHTLKALGGVVGHQSMSTLTHTLETLVQQVQEGRVELGEHLLDTFFVCLDLLREMSRDVLENRPPTPCDTALEQLQTYLVNEKESPPVHGFTQAESDDIQEYLDADQPMLDITIEADPSAFAPAARLYQAAIALLDVGHVVASDPNLETLSEDTTRLRLIVRTDEPVDAVQRWLIEIPDLKRIEIVPYLPQPLPESDQSAVEKHSQEAQKSFEETLEKEPKKEKAPLPTTTPETHGAAYEGVVRVPVERLDTLLNLVGELITHRTRLIEIEAMLEKNHVPLTIQTALSDVLAQHVQTIEQLQYEIMQTRMLPLAILFGKLPRVARDIARTQGKRVHVSVEGEETELDRSVLEMLQDPMVHLIRNAVDHGIETPEEREAAGKPPTGHILLRAEQRQGEIYLMVQDDGRGIDAQRVVEKAVARGILSEDEAAALSPEAAYNLLFQTGFSTRDTVSDISGRGVGLDVVRHAIERIGGSITVQSTPGRGTTFILRLPLTLIIMRALLFRAGTVLFAMPIIHVREIVRFQEAERLTMHGKPVLRWHGQMVPVVELSRVFGDEKVQVASPVAFIIVARSNDYVALPVDAIEDEREIVMKQLGRFVHAPASLTGCTILGDGRIAFIFDHHMLTREH